MKTDIDELIELVDLAGYVEILNRIKESEVSL
jgi:hypothetical protein